MQSNEQIELTIKAIAPTEKDKVASYESFTVKLSSERTGTATNSKLDASGICKVKVDKGSYTIEINGNVNGVSYFGNTPSTQYAANAEVSVPVKQVVSEYNGSMKGIVFREIFYNGGTYTGKMQHIDQYVIIQNNSDHDINVKGLVIAQASRMNTMPASELTALLPDYVAAANMYQIPMDKDYILKPNSYYVIASSALNHKKGREHKDQDTGIPADLSGADFELADADATANGVVTDNPAVQNLVKISNNLPKGVTGWMHPFGIRPMFLFDGSQIEWNSFKEANKVTYKDKLSVKMEVKEYHGYKIPTSLIIDGVETTSTTTPFWQGFQSKSLPTSVDKGKVEATEGSCHQNRYLTRIVKADGTLQDTNDSSVDMKLVHRTDFSGFPLKTN